jgi:hypothetical protein
MTEAVVVEITYLAHPELLHGRVDGAAMVLGGHPAMLSGLANILELSGRFRLVVHRDDDVASIELRYTWLWHTDASPVSLRIQAQGLDVAGLPAVDHLVVLAPNGRRVFHFDEVQIAPARPVPLVLMRDCDWVLHVPPDRLASLLQQLHGRLALHLNPSGGDGFLAVLQEDGACAWTHIHAAEPLSGGDFPRNLRIESSGVHPILREVAEVSLVFGEDADVAAAPRRRRLLAVLDRGPVFGDE